ncbi:MAG: rhodanese-like domain-containing protein [Phycisphaerae bacterium]
MRTPNRWTQLVLVALLILVGGGLAPLLYWMYVGSAPAVMAREARYLAENGHAVLVDVRPPEAFQRNHLAIAVNWPYEELLKPSALEAMPAQLRGKRLLVVCDGGILGAWAVRRFQELGLDDVANVRGGMQAMVSHLGRDCGCDYVDFFATASEQPTGPMPYREAPAYEQWVAVVIGFVVKPFYMLLALVIVAILWRRRSPELAALRWGLIFFFIGEAFCAANYLAYEDQSFLFEYLHSFGMVLCFGFATYAAFEGMDHWLIRYSDLKETCAALPLCLRCIKYADVPCGLRRMFYVLIPATIVLAFMPLLAQPVTASYNTNILGTFYNYSHPVIYQIYEIRYLPVAAIAALTASLLVLLLKKTDPVSWSKMLFAVGMGALGFSLMRLFILAPYGDNQVWFTFWEEITELMFVAGAGIVLWIFRPGLFPKKETS